MDNNISIKRCSDIKTTKIREKNGVTYIVFPRIEKLGFVDHLFSTRLGGVSCGSYSTMNLSYTRGDDAASVNENYRRIADVLGHGRTLDDFVCTFQTHTTNIRTVTEDDRGKGPKRVRDYTDIDGLITNVPGIILGTFHADCPPVYIIDPVKKAIGLVHSGWKGTQGQIGKKAVEKMGLEYGTRASDCVCAIGPSICGDCYEIGEDVALEFSKAFTKEELDNEKILIPYPNGKYRLFLWNAIKLSLKKAGVMEENIIVTDICTKCNPDILFSHRVHGEKRGNLMAFLSINDKTLNS